MGLDSVALNEFVKFLRIRGEFSLISFRYDAFCCSYNLFHALSVVSWSFVFIGFGLLV